MSNKTATKKTGKALIAKPKLTYPAHVLDASQIHEAALMAEFAVEPDTESGITPIEIGQMDRLWAMVHDLESGQPE